MSQPGSAYDVSVRDLAEALALLPEGEQETQLRQYAATDPPFARAVRTQLDTIRFGRTYAERDETEAAYRRLVAMSVVQRLDELNLLRRNSPALYARVIARLQETEVPAADTPTPLLFGSTQFPDTAQGARDMAAEVCRRLSGMPPADRYAALDALRGDSPTVHTLVIEQLRAAQPPGPRRPLLILPQTVPRESQVRPHEFQTQLMQTPSSPPPSAPSLVLRTAVAAYNEVVQERVSQRVNRTDWVAITLHNRVFDRLPPNAARKSGKTMPPGRPMTAVGQVTDLEYRIDAQTGLMNEHVTVRVGDEVIQGRRVMPGANDNTLMLPCAAPACAHPHLNGHPFCRTHRTENPGEAALLQVSQRLHELRIMLDESHLEDTKVCLRADADLLNQFLVDRRAALRRAQAAEDRRRVADEERRRQLALDGEAKERELLAQLMAKHGVVAAPKPKPNSHLTPGDRALDL